MTQMQDAMAVHETGRALDTRHEYDVVVGNIGSVYAGPSRRDAEKSFRIYVDHSKSNYGRAAGEAVVILRDDEVWKEYPGTLRSDGADDE